VASCTCAVSSRRPTSPPVRPRTRFVAIEVIYAHDSAARRADSHHIQRTTALAELYAL
jgi:hypothetical protein